MMGKWTVAIGAALVVIGAIVWLAESFGLPLGRLPGDIRMRGFAFPVMSCVVVSIAMTVLLNILLWLFRR